VVIGPLITLVVFKPGKRGLRFDLAVIGILQVAALLYGGYVMFAARPAFIVFVKDRFEVATPVDLEPERLAEARLPQFRKPPLWGPVMVAADMPTDRAEHNKVVEAAMAGLDLHNFPKYFVPYEDRKQQVLAQAQTLQQLRKTEPKWAQVVDQYLASSITNETDILFMPLRARRAWVGVLLDRKTGAPVKMLVVEKI
jgi:hypothetical protein